MEKEHSGEKKLYSLINKDSISMAEDLTGESYKTSEFTSMVALSLQCDLSKEKEKILKEQHDSYYSINAEDYISVIESIGFQKCLEIAIVDNENQIGENHYYIYFNPMGILLSFDTYFGNRLNGGHFYFNYKVDNYKDVASKLISLHINCSFVQKNENENGEIIVCSGDCREAIKFKIEELLKSGYFLNPWVKRPFLWLLHYKDNQSIRLDGDNKDYERINNERISLLQDYVKKCIGDK